jgi:hypothetical protein
MSQPDQLDSRLRLFVYRYMIRSGRCPRVDEMAKSLKSSTKTILSSLSRLSESHAFMQQENGELWRVAPFSAIPTPFPVTIGDRSWFGNCIWDALGIPAMLGKDARIDASCGCCNLAMPVEIRKGNSSPLAGSSTSPYRPANGTRMSPSPDAPCFCSGRNSTLIAGASNGNGHEAEPFLSPKDGSSPSSGTGTA